MENSRPAIVALIPDARFLAARSYEIFGRTLPGHRPPDVFERIVGSARIAPCPQSCGWSAYEPLSSASSSVS